MESLRRLDLCRGRTHERISSNLDKLNAVLNSLVEENDWSDNEPVDDLLVEKLKRAEETTRGIADDNFYCQNLLHVHISKLSRQVEKTMGEKAEVSVLTPLLPKIDFSLSKHALDKFSSIVIEKSKESAFEAAEGESSKSTAVIISEEGSTISSGSSSSSLLPLVSSSSCLQGNLKEIGSFVKSFPDINESHTEVQNKALECNNRRGRMDDEDEDPYIDLIINHLLWSGYPSSAASLSSCYRSTGSFYRNRARGEEKGLPVSVSDTRADAVEVQRREVLHAVEVNSIAQDIMKGNLQSCEDWILSQLSFDNPFGTTDIIYDSTMCRLSREIATDILFQISRIRFMKDFTTEREADRVCDDEDELSNSERVSVERRADLGRFYDTHAKGVGECMACFVWASALTTSDYEGGLYEAACSEEFPYAQLFCDTALLQLLAHSVTVASAMASGLPAESSLQTLVDVGQYIVAPAVLKESGAIQQLGEETMDGSEDDERELPIDLNIPVKYRYHSSFSCPVTWDRARPDLNKLIHAARVDHKNKLHLLTARKAQEKEEEEEKGSISDDESVGRKREFGGGGGEEETAIDGGLNRNERKFDQNHEGSVATGNGAQMELEDMAPGVGRAIESIFDVFRAASDAAAGTERDPSSGAPLPQSSNSGEELSRLHARLQARTAAMSALRLIRSGSSPHPIHEVDNRGDEDIVEGEGEEEAADELDEDHRRRQEGRSSFAASVDSVQGRLMGGSRPPYASEASFAAFLAACEAAEAAAFATSSAPPSSNVASSSPSLSTPNTNHNRVRFSGRFLGTASQQSGTSGGGSTSAGSRASSSVAGGSNLGAQNSSNRTARVIPPFWRQNRLTEAATNATQPRAPAPAATASSRSDSMADSSPRARTTTLPSPSSSSSSASSSASNPSTNTQSGSSVNHGFGASPSPNPPVLLLCGHVILRSSMETLSHRKTRRFKCPTCYRDNSAGDTIELNIW